MVRPDIHNFYNLSFYFMPKKAYCLPTYLALGCTAAFSPAEAGWTCPDRCQLLWVVNGSGKISIYIILYKIYASFFFKL